VQKAPAQRNGDQANAGESGSTAELPSKNKQAALAPAVGFEPTTNRLTADRSTTELRWIIGSRRVRSDKLPARALTASANRLAFW
jgi:hypothetical protein